MINNVSQSNSNISFKASIVANRPLLMNTISKESGITDNGFTVISNFLDKIDTFSKLKEDSIVDITAKAYCGKARIICNVYDSTKRFFAPVTQRTVKSIINDDKYREQHLSSMKTLIKNVAVTRNSIDKITESIKISKGQHFDAKNVEECLEKYDSTTSFIDALSGGFNPTKRIIKLFNAVDKKTKPETKIHVSIFRQRGSTNAQSNAYLVFSFKNGGNVEEKRIHLSELFAKPIEDRLSQK